MPQKTRWSSWWISSLWTLLIKNTVFLSFIHSYFWLHLPIKFIIRTKNQPQKYKTQAKLVTVQKMAALCKKWQHAINIQFWSFFLILIFRINWNARVHWPIHRNIFDERDICLLSSGNIVCTLLCNSYCRA